jgi:hypothetical protein
MSDTDAPRHRRAIVVATAALTAVATWPPWES